ncbi:MAG: ParA family protein [Syntrophorhabdaceae bacterium]|nr:ParA family protein [Syntrophorhabdaceae bacterium]MDD4197595.1 ParA family protein [Syntrophorhabdaceae bacterium]
MGAIITVANHKGGVGKSALVKNLSSYMTKFYKNILVLDFDPQANTSKGLFNLAGQQEFFIQDVLKYAVTHRLESNEDYDMFNQIIWSARIEMTKNDGRVSLIGSSLDLAKTKKELSTYDSEVYFRIIEAIRYLAKDYDLTLIDTPPSLEMLTASAIYGSNYLIIPIQLDLDAISGATQILSDIVSTAHKYYNPELRLLGIIINLHRDTVSQRVSNDVAKKTFGKLLFKTIISQSEKIYRLATSGGTLDNYSSKSKSHDQLTALAKEIYDRLEEAGNHGQKK